MTGNGYTMRRCCGEDPFPFDQKISDVFSLGSEIFTVRGYHAINDEGWVCLLNLITEEKRDVRIAAFNQFYETGAIHEANPLLVLAHIGRLLPREGAE